MTRSALGHALIGLLTGVLGLFLGAVVTLHHRSFPPGGLILGLLLVTAWGVGLRVIGQDRTLALVGLLGVLAAQLLLSSGLGGSFVVVAEPLGYALTLGVVMIGAVVLGWPRVTRVSRYDGKSREGE